MIRPHRATWFDPEPYEIDERMPPLKRRNVLALAWDLILKKAGPKAPSLVIGFIGKSSLIWSGMLLPTIMLGQFFIQENFWRILGTHPYYLACVLAVLATTFLVSLYHVLSRRRQNARLIRSDMHCDFKIIQANSLCMVINERHIVYRHAYFVEARRNGIDKFPLGFSWTGSGDFGVALKNREFEWEIQEADDYYDNIIVISLGQKLSKGQGEFIEFDFITKADSGEEANPSQGISIPAPKFPRFNNHLIVAFAKGCPVGTVYLEEYFSVFSRKALRRSPVSLREGRRYRWTLPNRVGWRYCIRWSYGA